MEKEEKFFSRVDILGSLSSEEVEQLERRTPEVYLDRGQTFYTPAYASRILFLLLEGRIRLYKAVGGQELTLEVIEAGTIFGEATFAGRPQGVYAEALEPSRVALAGLDGLERLVRTRPEVGLKIIELLSERLYLYGSRMADVALREVPARLASLVLRLVESEGVVTGEDRYRIPTRYTHEQLATMVGANREAVTRALRRLREEGAVQTRSRYMYVTDLEALKRASG
jgi:CRP/FNR family transcriptional regulator